MCKAPRGALKCAIDVPSYLKVFPLSALEAQGKLICFMSLFPHQIRGQNGFTSSCLNMKWISKLYLYQQKLEPVEYERTLRKYLTQLFHYSRNLKVK